jgi:diguanylate cyclase (GGDEF)-like protein/PAS domain S-box-containing protein
VTGVRAASTEQVLAVLDGLPAMVGYWDRDLRNVLANRAFLEYAGMSAAQVHGAHLSEVVGAAAYAANLPHLTRALAGEGQLFYNTVVGAEGGSRHIQASYVPDEHDGEVRGLFVLVTDITERVASEQALAQSIESCRALARSVPGFVLLFDADLRFVIAEGVALATFGFGGGIEGRTMPEVLPDEIAAELEPRYRAALAGGVTSWQRRMEDKLFELTASPVIGNPGDAPTGMVIARDVTEQHRDHATLAALHEIAMAVACNAPFEVVCQAIAGHLLSIFNASSATVVKFCGSGVGEIAAMAPARPASVPRLLEFPRDGASATAEVAATGAPALVVYAQDGPGLAGALREAGLRAGAAAPIRFGERLWGSVGVASESSSGLTPAVLDRLASFAQLLEIALGNLDAWDTLSVRAATDPLTGLANRRAFEERLAQESALAEREGRGFSIAVVDIDNFKQVNDVHGHEVGDQVLVAVADRLRAAVRGSDLVVRLGGEEFVWLLPACPPGMALRVAERARLDIAARLFPGPCTVTVSIGVCGSADVTSVDEVLAAADRAMFRAKRAGRNRTIRHQPAG